MGTRSTTAMMVIAAAMLLAAALSAKGDLIFHGDIDVTGTGFGATDPILVLQRPGSGPDTVSGATGIDSDGNPTHTGDARIQGEARDIADLLAGGIVSPEFLGIVFNINEPGTVTDRTVVLTDLSITIYSAVGDALFTGIYTGPDLELDPINPGTGAAGYLFMLDAAQAAAAAPFWNPGHYLGAEATIGDARAGPEQFFPVVIPEPTSLLLLGAGSLLLLARRRRV